MTDARQRHANTTAAGSFGGLTDGFAAVPAALGDLVRRGAWLRLALLAGIVQIGVALTIAMLLATRVDDLLGGVVSRPDGGLWAVLWVVVWLLLVGGALAMGLVVGMGIGGAVASPVYDRLIDRVEASEGVAHPEPDGPAALVALRGVVVGIGHALAYLALWAAMALAALALNVLPVVGQIAAAAAGLAVSTLTLALQATDGAASRRDLSFVAKLQRARRHAPVYMGLGAGMAALALVPVVSLLAAPAAVVAGTRLTCRLDRNTSDGP